MRLLLLGFFLLSNTLRAGSFPNAISASEFDRIVEILGYGGATRIMRSAEPYYSFPGFKLGVEIAFTPASDINQMGDGTGTLPGLIIAPRVFMAKGLFSDMELIFSFFSNKFFDTLVSVGSILKYTFYSEKQSWVSAAAFLGYTGSSGFKGDFKGTNLEFGAYFSKDYVRLKPYLGAALLLARGEIPQTAAIEKFSGWASTIHFFLGIEFEFPVNVTVQLDMMNLSPSGSLFIGKRF